LTIVRKKKERMGHDKQHRYLLPGKKEEDERGVEEKIV